MRAVPSIIQTYLLGSMLEDRSPAYLCVDQKGRVLRAGGHWKRYGLAAPNRGSAAAQGAYFLVGILPFENGPLVMPRLEVAPSIFADVHLFTAEHLAGRHVASGAAGVENRRSSQVMGEKECWIVLLDASAEVAERIRIEQALRQAEERLRQAERMESVGRLAGGIAHDFNNLLTAILGYGEVILGKLEERDPLHSPVLEIRRAAERGSLLIRQLLAFSRRQVVRTSTVDLNETIMDAIEMLRRVVGEDVHFALNLEQGLGPVEADRNQMQQVVLNLAVNARDAMPGGGVVSIETCNAKDIGSPACRECVVLRFADTGIGMDEATRARIFEPFFTTKEVGKGTGLGLSTVYGIVTQCGGEILVRSAPGEGTEFEIRFPRVAGEAPSAPQAKTEPIAHARGETILLVEDDELVQGLVRQLLASMGYVVLEANSATQALEVSERHAGPIDLLLTDVVMPQMSGTELAERLHASRPKLKTLFMSGYSTDALLRRGQVDMWASFIGKPFNLEQLSRAIREALADTQRRTSVSSPA